MIAAALHRLHRLRRAILIGALLPFAVFAISAAVEGRFWRADLLDAFLSPDRLLFSVLGYWAIVAGAMVIWPAAISASLILIAAGALLLASLPWLIGNVELARRGFDIGEPYQLIFAFLASWLLVWLVAKAIGSIRIAGPVEMTSEISVAAAPEIVFEQMRAENALAAPEHGVTATRTGDRVVIDYGANGTMAVREVLSPAEREIVTEAETSVFEGMVSRSTTRIIADGEAGVRLETREKVWSAPLGILAMMWISDVMSDFARSHRDRIEGNAPVSARDRTMQGLKSKKRS